MTSGTVSGTVMFQDKEFNIKALEQAISKSNETYIEAGKEIHVDMFKASDLPLDWPSKFKKPVVTMHEGKYVIIVFTDVLQECIGIDPKMIVVTKGFKAKFVTKYNFNQSKVANEVAPVPAPVKEIRPAYSDKAAPQWKPNNGFQKNQSEGYSGYNRNNTRSGKP